MSTIYLSRGTVLKTYKASVTGTKATVDIKIEINDHSELGFFLKELAEIQAAQKASAKPASPKKPVARALPAPHLQLPYFPGDET